MIGFGSGNGLWQRGGDQPRVIVARIQTLGRLPDIALKGRLADLETAEGSPIGSVTLGKPRLSLCHINAGTLAYLEPILG